MVWTSETEEDRAERHLGTAAQVLLARGERDAAGLLAESALRYHGVGFTTAENWYEAAACLFVDPWVLSRFDRPLLETVQKALQDVVQGDEMIVMNAYAVPRAAPDDWRTLVAQAAAQPVSNQGGARLLGRELRADDLRFADQAEVTVYEALKRLQAQMGRETIGIAPNAAVRLRGRTVIVDFLVTYAGRCGVIEVDGLSHQRKYASDKSRDALLEDAGVARIDRIDAADVDDPAEVEVFLRRFLDRLAGR